MNFCVNESTTLYNPPFSYFLIISLHRYLTYIPIKFCKTAFIWLWVKKFMTASLETHHGLTLVWESTHSRIFSINFFVLYFQWPFIGLWEFNMDISAHSLYPLHNKFRASLRKIIVSFVKFLIVGSNHVDLETPLFISASLELEGDSNIEQVIIVIINFYQPHFSILTCLKPCLTLILTYYFRCGWSSNYIDCWYYFFFRYIL